VDGIYKSADRGESWSLISELLSGIQPANILRVDPQDLMTLYAVAEGFPYRAFWKSRDGGATWQKISKGLPTIFSPTQLEIVPGMAYLVANGIYKSEDDGLTWTLASPNLPAGRLVVNPRAPSQVYSGGDEGFFSSTDAGQTWTRSTGDAVFSGYGIVSVTVDPTDFSAVYVVAFSGIFKSRDSGHSWIPAMTGLNGYEPTGFAIAPDNPSILYVSTNDGPFPCCFSPPPTGGLYQSVDGGAWWILLSRYGSPYEVLTDPTGHFLYTSSDDGVSVYEVVESMRVPVEGPIHHRRTIIRPLAGR
jgi:photosystem II stability/assembly factor-like uncharacterized protein